MVRGCRRFAIGLIVVFVGAGCATIDRVNTSSTGAEANADSGTIGIGANAAVSGTGRYVAFDSAASNLVPGQTDGLTHVYRKDRLTGTTVEIDLGATGAANVERSWLGAISDDGNRVAFMASTALTSDDLNSHLDVYVRDVKSASTVLASLMPDGSQTPSGTGSGVSEAAFDASGRLLFEVGAGTLPPRNRLELRDLAAKTTTEVLGNSQVTDIFFSRNGEHVVYNTGCFQIGGCFPTPGFVDVAHPYPFTASVCSGSRVAGVSDDGRYVIYRRAASGPNCVGGPARFDRETGTWLDLALPSSLLSLQSVAALSGDGRFVVILAEDTALPGGTLGFIGVFVRDTLTGWVGRVSADRFDHAANATATYPDSWTISRDGRTVVLTSTASNLVPDDTNAVADVFARALPRAAITSVAPGSLARRVNHATVTVSGDEFVSGVIASFSGTGVTVHSATPSANGHALTLDVSVAGSAAIGARTLTVTNVGGFGGVQSLCLGCLTIT